MELERKVAEIEAAIAERIQVVDFRPGKFSVWIKFVRLMPRDGSAVEETLGPVQKLAFTAGSPAELIHQVADNLLLAVFGAEAPVVKELPNLIVKVLEKKAFVPVAGAPPLDQAGQVFAKATVYRFEPGLWAQLFGRGSDPA